MNTRRLGKHGPNVSAIGFGGMYLSITSTPPASVDRAPARWRPSEEDALRTLAAAFDAGITLVDTANVYCFDDGDLGHNERLIAKALARWGGDRSAIVVATKGGLARPDGAWTSNARPEALRAACEASLRDLGVEAITLYQLHAPDDRVPFAESVGALARLKEEGKILHAGLSNVSVSQIEEASAIVPVASVQNRWSPMARAPESDGVLAHCTAHGIAFLPYSPFGGARGAASLGSREGIARVAASFGMSPHRLVLAWMLAKSPVVIPIPGGRRAESVRDSASAADVALSAADVLAVEASFS